MAINDRNFYASHGFDFDYKNMLDEYIKGVIRQAKIEVLTELQLEIEEKEQYYQDKFLESKNAVHDAAMGGRMFGCGECKELIQLKINALKENKDDK